MKFTYKPSFTRVIVIIFLVISFISMVYSIGIDTYLHYKLHVGELAVYDIESHKSDSDEVNENVFERIGTIDGYVLIYDTRTGLVYIGDERGSLTPYYSNASGKIVVYDRDSHRLVY